MSNPSDDPVLSDALDGIALGEAAEAEEVLESRTTDEETKGYETVELPKDKIQPVGGDYKRPGWFTKLLQKAKLLPDDRCLRIKDAGGLPESKHSPLKRFGYVTFDVNTKKHSVFAGLPLTVVNGFPVPMKVGSRDYVIQGDIQTVLIFLECFSDYNVRGSFLGEDGHWHDAPQQEFPLYIQIENSGPQAFGSVRQMVMLESVRQLLKKIAPATKFNKTAEAAIARMRVSTIAKSALTAIATKWRFVKTVYKLSSVLHLTSKEVQEVWDEIGNMDSFTERAKRFVKLLKQARKTSQREKWTGQENVSLDKEITLTLTMYPQMEHQVRATMELSSSFVKLEEVLKAVNALLTRTGLDVLEKVVAEGRSGGN